MEIEPIRVDTEFARDPDYEYETMRDMVGEHMEEESFKLVNALAGTMYYRGRNDKLFRHLVEALGRHLGKEQVIVKRIDNSFKRVIVEG